MKYQERIQRLRAEKERQTLEKMERNGYMDEDDYGSVPAPEGFEPHVEFNDPVHHTFYGAKLWGRNFRHIMETHPTYVNPCDALAGRWMFILQRLRPFESAVSAANMEMAPVFNFDHLKPLHEKYCIVPGIGKMHHFAGDYRIGLELGYGGLLAKVRRYAALYPDKEEFYTAEEDVLLGIQAWISHTVETIRQKLATQTDPDLRDNLAEMLEANEWLVENPPRTFREACQWIAWNNMAERTYCRAGAGCQLDEILLPYYQRDVQAGILDDEKATYILACLLINDPHYYQISGPDANGQDMTNELSFLILEAAHLCRTTCNITIRVHDGLDERLFRRGLEILFEDRKACPRFSGDAALVSGFMKNGYSAELARRRIAVGCNWMSLPGLEYTMNDLIKINLAKVFEVAFEEYAPQENRTVEGLYALYRQHLATAIACVAEGIDFHLQNQHKNAPELMLNLLSHGPIEKGLDASNGGMKYYNIGVDGCGLATVADSFAALEQRIEREGVLTWGAAIQAVRQDFAGVEGERIRRMMQSIHRFGYGNSRIYKSDIFSYGSPYNLFKHGIVRTAEYQSIAARFDYRLQIAPDSFFYHYVLRRKPPLLNHRHKQRAARRGDLGVWHKLQNFLFMTLAHNGCRRADNAYFTVFGFIDRRCRRVSNHFKKRHRKIMRNVRRYGGYRSAGGYNQLNVMLQQKTFVLRGIFPYRFTASRSVRNASGIAEIDYIFFRKALYNLFRDGKTAQSGVKNTYCTTVCHAINPLNYNSFNNTTFS